MPGPAARIIAGLSAKPGNGLILDVPHTGRCARPRRTAGDPGLPSESHGSAPLELAARIAAIPPGAPSRPAQGEP